MKQDQCLHTKISEEYNKAIPEYAGDAHPEVEKGRNSNAGLFTEIDWQKSKKVFSQLSNEYDKAFWNWKKSGYHGEFPDEEGAEPFSQKKTFGDFVNGNCSLLYMHRFVFQFPDCLHAITGELIYFCSHHLFDISNNFFSLRRIT